MRYLLNIRLSSGYMQQLIVSRTKLPPNRRAFDQWCNYQIKKANIDGYLVCVELM
jgi:hypothetical protein